jgi:hypothetical protein
MPGRLITTMQDLRPGDMFLGPIGGLVGAGVSLGLDILGEAFRSGTLDIRHAGIIVEAAKGNPDRPTTYVEGPTGPLYQPPLLAQAMPSGAEIVPLSMEHHWTERCAYVRLPEDYLGQALDAAYVARLMVQHNVGYGWLSYPALTAYKIGIRNQGLRAWINRRQGPITVTLPSNLDAPMPVHTVLQLPVEAICSVFNDQAWSLVGKDLVDDTHPQAVTPGLLGDVLSDLHGAVWARPRGVNLPARTWRVDGGRDL